jgi:hypothetical protein
VFPIAALWTILPVCSGIVSSPTALRHDHRRSRSRPHGTAAPIRNPLCRVAGDRRRLDQCQPTVLGNRLTSMITGPARQSRTSRPVNARIWPCTARVWEDAWVDAGDIEQVVTSELALLSPQVRRSRAQVDELLDPEFREIGASVRMRTRPEMTSALPAEVSDNDEPVTATDLQAAVVGPGLILVTYMSDRRGRRARRSSLWRRSGRAWRLLHHHGRCSPTPDRDVSQADGSFNRLSKARHPGLASAPL